MTGTPDRQLVERYATAYAEKDAAYADVCRTYRTGRRCEYLVIFRRKLQDLKLAEDAILAGVQA